MYNFKKVVLGLSGGRDSVYLLHWLIDNNFEVIPVHVNHNIRGEEAKRDEDFCVNLCKELGLVCNVINVDVPAECKKFGGSIETVAARLRREVLMKASVKNDGCPIALAHHKNDNVETILFRLCRGCGGFKGMKTLSSYAGVRIFRPLLDMTRHEITEKCEKNGWKWVEDSTNKENDVARNIIRNVTIPSLKEALGHPVIDNFAKSVELEKNNGEALKEAIELLPVLDPQGRIYLPYLQDKSDELCAAIIKWYVEKNGFPNITSDKITELVNISKYRSEKTSVSFGIKYHLRRKNKRIYVVE